MAVILLDCYDDCVEQKAEATIDSVIISLGLLLSDVFILDLEGTFMDQDLENFSVSLVLSLATIFKIQKLIQLLMSLKLIKQIFFCSILVL